MSEHLLSIRDLAVHFPVPGGVVRAVDGVSFDLAPGEVLGLVGESGSGKSTTARAIMGLAPIAGGSVVFDGRELIGLRGSALRQVRSQLQMVFQDPYASLDPRFTAGDCIAEPLRIHGRCSRREAMSRAAALMERVGLDPGQVRRYPHEFSGGQRQRIGIARALALEPRVLLCDEPVSALDVSVQASILNLLLELKRSDGLALVFIAHDLAVVRHVADRVAVMYAGRIVEAAPVDALFTEPRHPYSRLLLDSIPGASHTASQERGEPPSPERLPPGCPFAPRCPRASEDCTAARPKLSGSDEHRVACCDPLSGD